MHRLTSDVPPQRWQFLSYIAYFPTLPIFVYTNVKVVYSDYSVICEGF